MVSGLVSGLAEPVSALPPPLVSACCLPAFGGLPPFDALALLVSELSTSSRIAVNSAAMSGELNSGSSPSEP